MGIEGGKQQPCSYKYASKVGCGKRYGRGSLRISSGESSGGERKKTFGGERVRNRGGKEPLGGY